MNERLNTLEMMQPQSGPMQFWLDGMHYEAVSWVGIRTVAQALCVDLVVTKGSTEFPATATFGLGALEAVSTDGFRTPEAVCWLKFKLSPEAAEVIREALRRLRA